MNMCSKRSDNFTQRNIEPMLSLDLLYITHENLADSDPVIIPYMVVNIRFITLYGHIMSRLYDVMSTVKDDA